MNFALTKVSSPRDLSVVLVRVLTIACARVRDRMRDEK